VPSAALFDGRHAWPVLHFFKRTAAAFAKRITLAGGANSDAGCVWCGVVPSQPGSHRFGRETVAGSFNLTVIHHQRIHRGERPQLRAQRDTVGRGTALAPVVDGGFDVDNMDGGGVDGCVHGAKNISLLYKYSVYGILAQKSIQANKTSLLSYKSSNIAA
jgi:hypothetical protein